MVDPFGGGRQKGRKGGARGQRGPPGEVGSIKDLCQWMSNTTTDCLHCYEETCCFLLTLNSDIAIARFRAPH